MWTDRSVPLGMYWRSSHSVLVGSALPRLVWIAEVDLDAGGDRELRVVGHLLALVPGDAAAQLRRQRADRLPHRLFHAGGVAPVRQVQQHHVAGGPLDQGSDRGAAVRPDE